MSPEAVLDFWFSAESRKRWFDSTPVFDRRVASEFESLWREAARSGLDEWERTPEGALALVIVLDQFPIHIFRMQAEAFSTEAQARAVAGRAIAAGYDRRVAPEQRGFFYLPFMHSESMADQEFSVSLYGNANLPEGLQWARHHREVIRRFGRFPHRNRALGRVSTPEEEAYLQSSGAFHG